MKKPPTVGRFAPTPTRYLHAGNLLCALVAYLAAKSVGGKFLIRIEDSDKTRCPKSAAQSAIDMLARLGITSDEPPVYQSERSDAYRRALEMLRCKASVYPCFCTRAELHAAEAPRLSDGGIVYDGRCRGLSRERINELSMRRKPCIRIAAPDETVSFRDILLGDFEQNLKTDCGDFILQRSDGVFAYQLAVVVDDGDCGITQVVRGSDLIDSTPRQIWLQRLLGYRTPEYCHIPLVCDASGRKLAKTDGDDANRLFDRFTTEEILGGLAFAAGQTDELRPAPLDELTEIFAFDKIPEDRILLPDEFSACLDNRI